MTLKFIASVAVIVLSTSLVTHPARAQSTPAPDRAKMESEIDAGFKEWGQTWLVDRFISGSVRISDQRRHGNVLDVNGQFGIARFGEVLPVGFTAALQVSGGGKFSISTLCYTDGSTGMRDCVGAPPSQDTSPSPPTTVGNPSPSSVASVPVAPVLPGPTSVPLPARISADQARKAVLGTIKGNSPCGKQIGGKFQITEATESGDSLQLKGSFESFKVPGQPKPPELNTLLVGTFDLRTGFLRLQSTAKEKGNGCFSWLPKKMLGQKMECNYANASIPFQILHERSERKAADLASRSTFTLIAARDAAGRGWAGTMINPSFECPEITLTPDGGTTTGGLPPVTADASFGQARALESGTAENGPARVYWLKVAAEMGHRDANAFMGKALEYGEGVPKAPARAIQYYRVAGDAGDARAQGALASMYRDGVGTAVDIAESERWSRLAEAIQREASKVCLADGTLREIDRLIAASLNDPSTKLIEILGGALVGMRIDSGSFRVIDVKAMGVSSIDRPFACQVMAMHVNASVTNEMPAWEAVEDQYGNVYYRDRRFEQTMNRIMASAATELANRTPFAQPFQVQPQGQGRFKVVLVQQLVPLMREYSAIVEVK
jgi:hypothetical protein